MGLFGKNKKEKLSQEQVTINWLVEMDATIDRLNVMSASYNEYIDEAAINGDEAYSNQLIDDQIEIDDVIGLLRILRTRVKLQVATSKVYEGLSKLPDIMDALKTTLDKKEMTRVNNNLKSLMVNLKSPKSPLAEIKKALQAEVNAVKSSEAEYTQFFENPKDKNEISERAKARRLAREERLKNIVSNQERLNTIPNENVDNINIDWIINNENNK